MRRRVVCANFRQLLLRVALLGLLGAGCAALPPTPDSLRVDRFDIEGTKALSQGAIKSKILTNAKTPVLPDWVLSLNLFGHLGWYDPTSWQADLRRITRFYEANGYYQATLLEDTVTETKPGHVKLMVRLREGQPTHITKFRLEGLPEGFPALLDQLPTREKDIFYEELWRESKTILASRLRELGFAEAEIEGEALVDPDAARAELTLNIDTGPRYRFGQIFVATDPGSKVPAKYIADQVRDDMPLGAYYSDSALNEAQSSIFALGVFSGAKVNRGAPEREAAEVPVVIDVREAPFRSIRAGGGISGDLIRQEARVILEYTDRNLGFAKFFSKNALLDKLSIKTKFGWAFLPTVLSVIARTPDAKQGPIGRVLTEYEVPRLFGFKKVAFKSSLDLSRVLDTAYDYIGGELKFGPIWRPRRYFSVFPSINIDTYFLQAPVALSTVAATAAVGCPTLPKPCIVTYLDILTELDKRDNRLEPTQGIYASLDIAGGIFQANTVTPFVKFLPEVRGYYSPDRHHKLTFAAKLRAGTLIAAGNGETPIVARFFSGGSLMRGFNQRRLSPLVAVPTTTFTKTPCIGAGVLRCQGDDNGASLPIGGKGLIEFSLEARWNLWGDLIVALFTDWGMVTSAPLGPETSFSTDLYGAVGFGFRYKLPIGPVRLDLAMRLPGIGGPRNVDQKGNMPEVKFPSNGGCFGLGNPYYGQNSTTAAQYSGAPDDICTFHLSIGEAF